MDLEPQRFNALDPREVIQERYEVDDETGCWEWSGYVKEDNGYGEMSVNGSTEYAHRVSYTFHNGEIGDDEWVLHKCHNKICINPDHLYLGDVRDNVKDAIEEGSFWSGGQLKDGEENVSSKLTAEQVREIREGYETTDKTMRDLADGFGVTAGNIHAIIHRRSWDHI